MKTILKNSSILFQSQKKPVVLALVAGTWNSGVLNSTTTAQKSRIAASNIVDIIPNTPFKIEWINGINNKAMTISAYKNGIQTWAGDLRVGTTEIKTSTFPRLVDADKIILFTDSIYNADTEVLSTDIAKCSLKILQ